MRINTNIAALNTYNKMQMKSNAVAGSMAKLSSSLRINEAADDSAGLAISEKMRGQIRGLEQAEQNIKDGISLVQVAEAGLGQIANPNLLRLRELAISAANDTLTLADRKMIQQEIDETLKGINQIARNTEFNTIKLLDSRSLISSGGNVNGNGGYNYENVLSKNSVDANGSFTFRTDRGYPTTDADNDKILIYNGGSTSFPTVRIDNIDYPLKSAQITPTVEVNGSQQTVFTILDKNVEVTQTVSIVKDKYEIKYNIVNNSAENRSIGFMFNMDTMLGNDDHAPFIVDGQQVNNERVFEGNDIPNNFTVYNRTTGNAANAEFQAGGIVTGDGIIEAPSKMAIGNYSRVPKWDFSPSGGAVGDSAYSLWWNERGMAANEAFTVNTFYGQSVPPTIQDPSLDTEEIAEELILQVGANEYQQFKIQLSDATVSGLELTNLSVLSNLEANAALQKIDHAIQLVIKERTKYGAYQNALEHINNNVANYKENLTASESRIRDLDMPKEITKLTNNQIILQSSQAMLAQANQQTQSILEFLK